MKQRRTLSCFEECFRCIVDDFHHLSGGNPRVERYAIDFSASDQQKALSILRPEGKNLRRNI